MLANTLDSTAKTFYDDNGYFLARGLFGPDEISFYRQHFMEMRERGSYPYDSAAPDPTSPDPLRRYPRLTQMHRWDETSLNWLLDERLAAALQQLLGQPPFAVQTMLYFKPPKARGQALHQDNYYLRVQPGNCIAAWLALDKCDEANGCLQIVPGSHRWELLCTQPADLSLSFTDHTVPIPAETEVKPVVMEAGDVLFFNGYLVHGSFPNTTPDRFRRALIGHYIEGAAQEVYDWYHPVLRMDGSEISLEYSQSGSRCGIWVDSNGEPVIEMSGYEALSTTGGE